jgi:hypothetical protein
VPKRLPERWVLIAIRQRFHGIGDVKVWTRHDLRKGRGSVYRALAILMKCEDEGSSELLREAGPAIKPDWLQ